MLQLLLRHIRLNNQTGFYEATEAAINYQIDQSLINHLAEYLKNHPTKLISDWYRSLSTDDASKVRKRGC